MTWAYNQVRAARVDEALVLAEATANLDQFPFAPLYTTGGVDGAVRAGGEARSACACTRGPTRRALKRHRPQILHSHFGYRGWADLPLARRHRLAHVVTFYGHDVTMYPADLAGLARPLRGALRGRRPGPLRGSVHGVVHRGPRLPAGEGARPASRCGPGPACPAGRERWRPASRRACSSPAPSARRRASPPRWRRWRRPASAARDLRVTVVGGSNGSAGEEAGARAHRATSCAAARPRRHRHLHRHDPLRAAAGRRCRATTSSSRRA